MMRIVTLGALIFLGVLSMLPACWTQAKQSGLLVVNVLSASLYEDCHIEGSINVPFEELDAFIATLDKDAQVVFYCSNYMCTSSGYAAKKLREKGFEHAWAYEGGTAEWYQEGLPVVGPCAQPYLKKKMKPTDHDSDILVIGMQELARKMGVKKNLASDQ